MATPPEPELQALRSRAEDLAQIQAPKTSLGLDSLSHEAMRKMVYELQVHQIELEMQNEELRQTQMALDGARARYFDLYDLAPVGYCTISEQGLILEANFTAASMLEVVRSDLVNKAVSRFIVHADQDAYYRCHQALLETNAPQDCELQMRKANGAPVWVRMRITAAHEAGGKPVQRMILSDISERKGLGIALEVKNHALEQAVAVANKANQAKSDFLSHVTHELRSPLNTILGFAQLMEQDASVFSGVQQSNIGQILRAGWYLLDLIGEILDLSALESGRMVLTLAPVPLFKVLRDASTNVESAAHKKNMVLRCEPVSEALLVHTDRARLQQVLVHLLCNAIQYTPPGGTVELRCSHSTDQRLRVEVRDTGDGLSAEKVAHLFQPFDRLGSETRAEEGTGIGLALSKRLVELMGGTMGAYSTVGEGSVFWIEIPCASPPSASGPC